MSNGIFPTERYFEHLKEFRSHLSSYLTDDRAELRAYFGVFHGLNEVVKALYQTFPHRPKATIFKGLSPYSYPIVRLCSKEGIQVSTKTKSDLVDTERLLEDADKETLFFLLAEDDPLTGELFPISKLVEKLSKKRIFSLVVSHRSRLISGHLNPPNPFSSILVPLKETLAIGVLGARTKVDDLIYGGIHTLGETGLDVSGFFESAGENKNLVEGLENEFESNRFFDDSTKRLFDRAVLRFEGVDASAVTTFMDRDFNIKGLHSGSQCEWRDEKYMNWLTESGLPVEKARGLLTIPVSVISADTSKQLKQTLEKVRKLQGN